MPDSDRNTRAFRELTEFRTRLESGENLSFEQLLRERSWLAEMLETPEFKASVLDSVLQELGRQRPDTEVEGAEGESEPPPQRFGRFELREVLGQGGMGAVYRAFDTVLNRDVALKRIRPELLLHKEVKLRFELEARALSAVDHPNVCQLYDVGDADGSPYLVMHLVTGESLANRIPTAKDRPSGESVLGSRRAIDETIELVEKVARALHHVHELGLIHRDVKPGNVVVTDQGEPVLIDFGLVREESSDAGLTLSGTGPGTRAYMSPEQVHPAGRQIDRRSDVYSLGVVLYECLALDHPFTGATPFELAKQILAGARKPIGRVNPRIPRDLEIVVDTAMALDREHRYATAEAFADDLRAVREMTPIRARAPSTLGRAYRWCRRQPTAAALIALMLVSTVVVSWLWLLSEQRLAEIDLTSKLGVITQLESEAESLYPVPRHPEAAANWRKRAETALAELPDLRGRLDAIPMNARKDTALDELVKEAGEFEVELYASIHRELEWVPRIKRLSLVEAREDWQRIAADLAADSRFEHLPPLPPQLGLVPLHKDPGSGLWEFWHVRSGERPVRNEADDGWTMTEATGLVFVLLAPGAFDMGAQRTDPDGPNYFAQCRDWEGPVRRISVEPTLISKYELTQGQWQRLTHEADPSQYGARYPNHGVRPVETVSWDDLRRLFDRFDLDFPTDAQWEYAARGGTSWPWSSGADWFELEHCANLSDRAYRQASGLENWPAVEWDDRFGLAAPVGSFRPNPYGLHDVHGNVSEWTRDALNERQRWTRGGSFIQMPYELRSSHKTRYQKAMADYFLGVRPIHALRWTEDG